MQDVKITPNAQGLYDLAVSGGDFESVDGFDTAVPVSLFTDSRAPAAQVQNAQSRRGWVGNILSVDLGRELGGLLWVLDQARVTDDMLNFARQYAQDSLQWLIDDSQARNVTVSVERCTDGIEIYITITTADDTVLRYVSLWRNTAWA